MTLLRTLVMNQAASVAESTQRTSSNRSGDRSGASYRAFQEKQPREVPQVKARKGELRQTPGGHNVGQRVGIKW